jgi:uncharacterized protein DUF4240
MDTEQFWAIIERARAAAGPAADQAIRDFDQPDDDPEKDYWDFADLDPQQLLSESDEADEAEEEDEEEDGEDWIEEITDPVAHALVEELSQLPAAEIASFEQHFEQNRARADQTAIVNAATLIEHGFLGDDGFEDFRAGLVALGRATFESVLANPDVLANHPIVREIAAANDPRWLGREDLLYAAGHAYAVVTGEDEVTFYDFVESLYPDEEPESPEEDEPEWDISDEAATRQHLPKLATLFYERSMRNRARAMERLHLQN